MEQRLRTLSEPRSRQWPARVADGHFVGNALSEKGSTRVGGLVFNARLLSVPGGSRLSGDKAYSAGSTANAYF